MNENQNSSQSPNSSSTDSSGQTPGTALYGPVPEPDASGQSRNKIISAINPVYAALAVLTLLLVAQWWSSTDQIGQLRKELARRLQSSDISNAETKVIAKTMLETSKELQVKVGILENKQTQSENHELALEQLYQDLSKNRDEWVLSEIEQVLSTASQQLQLAGNVQGALIALQNADARLARSNKPQFLTIRRAIAHDIDRLKVLPNLDLSGIALRLDSAISQVDSMPLWIDENPADLTSPIKNTEADHENAGKHVAAVKQKRSNTGSGTREDADDAASNASLGFSWKLWLNNHWQSWSTEMWGQFRQLVSIRNVQNPEALLLTPGQGYFAKENVKLRLLNARLALLSRSEVPFRSDMIAAQDEIARYFDTRAKQTQTVQALLRQIQKMNVSIEMPGLTESLNAVRNYTVKQ